MGRLPAAEPTEAAPYSSSLGNPRSPEWWALWTTPLRSHEEREYGCLTRNAVVVLLVVKFFMPDWFRGLSGFGVSKSLPEENRCHAKCLS
jgi:hypothetical protein